MNFCIDWENWLLQDYLANMDPTAAARRQRMTQPALLPLPSCDRLVEVLQPHLLSRQSRWTMGYPIRMNEASSEAVVYWDLPRRYAPQPLDANAPEFVPGQADSGRGSWAASPRSDSDDESDEEERVCVRCDKTFSVGLDNDYNAREWCVYHWRRFGADSRYSCCEGLYGSRGCTIACHHVWNGLKPGMNGPLGGYVRAREPRGGVFALDTEMCYTMAGLELASIAVLSASGRLVYETLVKPSLPVVDYNTRFSGIRPHDLKHATKTLRDVQNDLLNFIGTDTILIGHALDKDLRALKLIHSAVVDTCALYPHPRGLPMRRSLRALTEELLGRSILTNHGGHFPLEDANAALELVLLKVKDELIEEIPPLIMQP